MVNRNKNLENRLGTNNWAYTGSLAMKIHANRLGKKLPNNRKIGNINIAAKKPLFLVPTIAKKRWIQNGPQTNRHTKFYNNHGLTLNLFPANGRLAPNFIHVQKFNGYPPVMSLNSLLNQKRITRKNVPNRNLPKINKNIAFLEFLLNSNNAKKSPIRRRSPTPKRRAYRNSFNSPPRGGGGRRLIFS
jgi:hypothetical protein